MEGAETEAVRRHLLAFYDAHRRDLPWRRTSDPYAIWVSEVMLQQTRVETVIPYYERWLDRFPDVEALAGADQDEVLSLWKGLGYYSRARNLHRAAQVVRDNHAGRVPSTWEGLRALPGVGEYTAGAVGSIAFGLPLPVVDGNVRRVLARLFDLEDPTPGQLRDLALALVDPARPGDFNQALMELGATVCMPRSPGCETCPLARDCRALAAGTVDLRPPPRRRGEVPVRVIPVAVVRYDPRSAGSRSKAGPPSRFLVRRRPEEGLLGGMWEFPAVEVIQAVFPPEALPPLPGRAASLPEVKHTFTHLRAVYRPWLVTLSDPTPLPDRDAWRWATASEMETLALPVAQQKILESAMASGVQGEPGV